MLRNPASHVVLRFVPFLALPVLVTGCGLRGQERSPTFAAGARAPEPTIAVARLECGHGFGAGGEGLTPFDIIYKEKVPQQRATLPPEAAAMLCTVLGKPGMNVSGTSEWKPSAALAMALRDAAAQAGARSVFVPMVVPYQACENEAATLKNSNGQTVGVVETNRVHCAQAPRIDLRAFLFDESGALLWKSWSVADRTSTEDVERATARVLSGIPAVFRDAGAASALGRGGSSL